MPASLMHDGRNANLFADYAAVAQRTGVYTALDYVTIMEELIGRWKVETHEGLSPEGRQAQEFVCSLPVRMRRLAEREMEKGVRGKGRGNCSKEFSWIFDRPVDVL